MQALHLLLESVCFNHWLWLLRTCTLGKSESLQSCESGAWQAEWLKGYSKQRDFNSLKMCNTFSLDTGWNVIPNKDKQTLDILNMYGFSSFCRFSMFFLQLWQIYFLQAQ